ncbi:structural protein [Lactococcus phage AM2]|uniref:Structural protein n=7 Tax=Audreyjarvisvirus AM1 TaxID=2845188 RepID=A0A1W6JLV6_9CAUD|nr:structural protein [Lactococcus phage AM1]ARM66473.1 structural protein [Lactococcus phage AM2]ARM66650.1 structural protein [Lactococcus phage AM3]ARM67204.1 structural protein [Lactococcus phage AM8]ARM67383.1 structural protein [Lactococcus phage AM9]ARM67561.1 structural protein [Lactococcus phage AM11]ARQ95748.1 structural protein [Lactococcus phage AM12]
MVDNTKILNSKMINFEITESLSPLFSKARVTVMYHGENPNRSSFSKWDVEKAVPSLKNIPIVGYFSEEDENFGGHERSLVVEDDKIVVKTKTVPIGVVPESAVFSWENIVDKDGIRREYLVIDNALIWNRDEKLVSALSTDDFGQSMEITVNEYYTLDGIDYITDFYFTALCVLGIDKNGAGYVRPAFDDAKVQTYSKDDSLTESMQNMFKDLKFALNEIETIEKGEPKLKLEDLLAKFSLTEEELSAKVKNYAEIPVEEVEKELAEFAKAETDAKAKAQEDAKAKAKDGEPKKAKKPETSDNATIAKLEKQIEELKAENEKLKEEIKGLKAKNGKFELDNHVRECNDKVEAFIETYGLDESAVKELDYSAFENTDALEVKLFEMLGRMAKPVEKNISKEFAKITIKPEQGNKKQYSFEDLFN